MILSKFLHLHSLIIINGLIPFFLYTHILNVRWFILVFSALLERGGVRLKIRKWGRKKEGSKEGKKRRRIIIKRGIYISECNEKKS